MKLIIELIFWFVILVCIIKVPEFSVVVGIFLIVRFIYKRVKDKVIITFKKK